MAGYTRMDHEDDYNGIDWRLGATVTVKGVDFSVAYTDTDYRSSECGNNQCNALLARQVWWIGPAAATAAGLALLVFRRSPWVAAAAIVLFALPHLIGAPLLAEMETSVPDALAHEYIVAVILTGLLFWALLGSLSGALYRRFILRSDQPSLPRRGTG